jgi:uncharacterized SAM-binding protein YcdF (DUF218 family)
MEGKTVVIVLGKEGNNTGIALTEDTRRSVEKAVELFRTHKADILLMSGAYSFSLPERPRKLESEKMMEYAISRGVPDNAILKEEQSLDTTGNAYYTRGMIDDMQSIKQVIVVTVDYHMNRARYLFEKAFGDAYGITFVEAPSGLTGEALKTKQDGEKKTLDLMRVVFEAITNGDYRDFRSTVERTHPLYGKDPGTVPEIVWKGFESAGWKREVLIERFMKPRSRRRN